MDKEKVIKGLELLANWPDGLIFPDKENWIKPCCEMAVAMLEEQEPKIGHWILDPDGMDWNIPAWTCSECGGRHNGLPIMDGLNEASIYQFAGSQFCPNCGAKMSKEVKWDD